MKDEIYFFKSPGISSIAVYKTKASATFKLVLTNKTEKDVDATKLADKVKNGMNYLNSIKDYYPILSSEEISKS